MHTKSSVLRSTYFANLNHFRDIREKDGHSSTSFGPQTPQQLEVERPEQSDSDETCSTAGSTSSWCDSECGIQACGPECDFSNQRKVKFNLNFIVQLDFTGINFFSGT